MNLKDLSRSDKNMLLSEMGMDANDRYSSERSRPFQSFKQPEDTSEENLSKRYNTHVIINDEGQIISTYRKLHLFDVDLSSKGGITMSESSAIQRGTEITDPVYSPCGYLGLSISFDLRFPEMYRYLVLRGAQMLLVPSHFQPQTGASHWTSLLRARAIENQCYVVAAAQVGQHNKASKSYGHSMVVDPWGDVIGQMSDREGFFVCEIDFEYLDKIRGNMLCIN